MKPKFKEKNEGKMKVGRLLVAITLLLVFAVGCALTPIPYTADEPVSSFGGNFEYYYDEAHDVCIWTWRDVFSGVLIGGVSVLPADQVKNPDAPMELK